MIVKFARTGFICAFTTFFAFIAMMGEGLHILPGMGHSCDHRRDCIVYSSSAADFDGCCGHHSPAVTHEDQNPNGINNADDCAVCKFFALAKSCLLADHVAYDHIIIAERLVVCSPFFQSRFVGSYLSRAPPCDLLHV
jgi:hypothetical protein